MPKLFGTDGIIGIANKELTAELAMKIGVAGAYVLAGQTGRKPKILIGTDTRLSSDMLEAALIAGLCSIGAEVHKAGVVPSPAMAYLIRYYKLDAGIMLSASHNPMQDNGIKFFDSTGCKLSDEVEEKIEELFLNTEEIPRPTGADVGRTALRAEASSDYAKFLSGSLIGEKPLAGLKIALDCANGATFKVAPEVFAKLGADIIVMHDAPNGININDNCGSTHLASLQECVKKNNADIGLAFDGDGDRVLCVDNLGEVLDGDAILALCGLDMKKKGQLKNNTIVATVMSNLGLSNFCEANGINLRRTAVGDRYVLQEMLGGGFNLGGEQSGHIILSDYNSTGDGILTGLQLVAILNESGKNLSELRKIIQALPQVLLGAKGRLKGKLENNKKITDAMKNIEDELGNKGRLLVRPSGTEPLIRVMIEGPNEASIQKMAENLVTIIEKELSWRE